MSDISKYKNIIESDAVCCMDGMLRHIEPWVEIAGIAKDITYRDSHSLAQIGEILVIIPKELGYILKEVQGQQVTLLRTDEDFRLRSSTSNESDDAGLNHLWIVKDMLIEEINNE